MGFWISAFRGQQAPGAEASSTAGRGSVLHERCSPTAAKRWSRARLVAATQVSTSQWVLDKSQQRGKLEVKPGSQAGGSGSSSEGYMARHRHGCNSSGKGKEGVSELKKAPEWLWGAPMRLLNAFSWSRLLSRLTQGHITAPWPKAARQSSWPSRIYWSQPTSCSLPSPFSAQS